MRWFCPKCSSNRSLNRHHGVNPGYLLLTLGSSLRLRRNPRRLGDFWEFISRCIDFWETAVAVMDCVLYLKLGEALSVCLSRSGTFDTYGSSPQTCWQLDGEGGNVLLISRWSSRCLS